MTEPATPPRPDARALLAVQGPQRLDFLQGLFSNDLTPLAGGDAPGLIYAALLTPQGKYLFDVFISAGDDALWVDVQADQAPALLQRLSMYKLRAKVDIAPSDRPVVMGTGTAPAGALPDPRHPALGWRAYGDDASGLPALDITAYTAARVAHVVPETGVELTPDTFILEAGFERLHGVDFRKGCYVGQEVTARMKHKTDLRKGLVQVRVDGPAAAGSAITTDGRPAGTLFTRAGDRAIAYLRFDRADGAAMTAGGASVTWDGQQPG